MRATSATSSSIEPRPIPPVSRIYLSRLPAEPVIVRPRAASVTSAPAAARAEAAGEADSARRRRRPGRGLPVEPEGGRRGQLVVTATALPYGNVASRRGGAARRYPPARLVADEPFEHAEPRAALAEHPPPPRPSQHSLPGVGLQELADPESAGVAGRTAASAAYGWCRSPCRRRRRWFGGRGTGRRRRSSARGTTRRGPRSSPGRVRPRFPRPTVEHFARAYPQWITWNRNPARLCPGGVRRSEGSPATARPRPSSGSARADGRRSPASPARSGPCSAWPRRSVAQSSAVHGVVGDQQGLGRSRRAGRCRPGRRVAAWPPRRRRCRGRPACRPARRCSVPIAIAPTAWMPPRT